jgi:hypothetical protein
MHKTQAKGYLFPEKVGMIRPSLFSDRTIHDLAHFLQRKQKGLRKFQNLFTVAQPQKKAAPQTIPSAAPHPGAVKYDRF